MTTPEHTLVGIHLAFSIGAHQRFGWTVVALAGLASNVPDWDGLPMLVDMQRFEGGHRVWGHSFVAIIASSILLGWSQSRFQLLEKAQGWFTPILPADAREPKPTLKVHTLVFVATALIVQAVHLPCDMVVSGGNGLSDWHVKPFWPFSNVGYVYPLIPWGDVGPTVVLMIGAILLAKFPSRMQLVSCMTLLGLLAYLVIRSLLSPSS